MIVIFAMCKPDNVDNNAILAAILVRNLVASSLSCFDSAFIPFGQKDCLKKSELIILSYNKLKKES